MTTPRIKHIVFAAGFFSEGVMPWVKTITVEALFADIRAKRWPEAHKKAEALGWTEIQRVSCGMPPRKVGNKKMPIERLYAIRIGLEVERLKQIFEVA